MDYAPPIVVVNRLYNQGLPTPSDRRQLAHPHAPPRAYARPPARPGESTHKKPLAKSTAAGGNIKARGEFLFHFLKIFYFFIMCTRYTVDMCTHTPSSDVPTFCYPVLSVYCSYAPDAPHH